MQTYFLLDSFERARENLSCNVLLVDVSSMVRELSSKKNAEKGDVSTSAVPKGLGFKKCNYSESAHTCRM